MSACKLTLKLGTGVIHDRASSTSRPALGEARGSAGVGSVLLDWGVDNLIATRDRQAILTPDLTRCPSLSSYFGTECVDFFDNEALHAIDVIFFLEREVKDLSDSENEA